MPSRFGKAGAKWYQGNHTPAKKRRRQLAAAARSEGKTRGPKARFAAGSKYDSGRSKTHKKGAKK